MNNHINNLPTFKELEQDLFKELQSVYQATLVSVMKYTFYCDASIVCKIRLYQTKNIQASVNQQTINKFSCLALNAQVKIIERDRHSPIKTGKLK